MNPFSTAEKKTFYFATGETVQPEDFIIKHRVFQTRETISYERTQLSFLTLLGDIGALQSALFDIATLILGYLKIGLVLDNSLINSIFRQRVDNTTLKTRKVRLTFGMWLT